MRSKLSNEMQGILWMLLNAFWFSVMTSIVRYISIDLNVFVVVFFRNIFAVPIIALFILPYRKNLFSFNRLKIHFPRACIAILAMTLWFYAITIMQLPEAVSLSFITPLFTSIAAMIFLKEKVGYYRCGALIIGFVGVLIILRPTPNNFKYAAIFVLAATLLWSVSSLLAKSLTKTEHPNVIVFFLTLFMTPMSLPLAIKNWQWPNSEQLIWLFVLGMVSNFSHMALSKALSKTNMTVIMPFDFARLVFILLIAYFIFHQKPDIWTLVGGTIIILCSVSLVRYENKMLKFTNSSKLNEY